MSMTSENLNRGTAYFTDGHTEAIIEFEISKDCRDVWFTVESGQNYVYREEFEPVERTTAEQDLLDKMHILSFTHRPVPKFYKYQFVRHCDTFGAKWDVEYLVTDEIEKIKICVVE